MKDLKISKKLLSEVLGHEDICNERIIQNKLLYMCKNDGMVDYEYEYNIYEFVFIKCKKWAYTKCNYTLESKANPFGGFCKIKIYEIDIGKAYNKPDDVYRGANETEAILKACEWILENRDNK